MKLFVLFFVALLFMAPAMRLLFAAQRTKQKPELFAALYFIGAGIGLPLRLYGSSIFETQPELAASLNALGHLFFGSGAIAMSVFTWRVFHPDRAWARAFALTSIALIISTTAYTLLAGLGSVETSRAMMATNFCRLVPTYWAFYESLKYWGAMRKRAALGLSDPITTNRFLLWAIWTSAVSVLPTAALFLRLLEMFMSARPNHVIPDGALDVVHAGLRAVFVVIAPIAVAGLSLSFFPPESYLNRLRSRSEIEISD